ncbi:MAG: Flp pilus assembly complex ATPase component TadA, partial [Bdellovibrionales bacterium]|nr:Flp pilus assembly complex ATPase component TadA [Bdellovibrionales bacterium]
MRIQDEQLKRFILDAGLIKKSDISAVEKVAKDERRTLAEALISQGHMTEDDMRRIESYVLGIPFVSLKNIKIDFEVLALIPEPVARNHNIIAYKKNDKELEVAMLDTADLPAIDFVRKKVGLKILSRLTDTESMRMALQQYQKTLKDEFGDIIMKDASALKVIAEENGEEMSESDLKKMAEDLPVVRIIDTLLRHAIIQGASDIHIEPYEKSFRVRFRIDGVLYEIMKPPPKLKNAITSRIKIMADLDIAERRLPQDGRIKLKLGPRKEMDFRVSVLPELFGEKVVLRLLDKGNLQTDMTKLGFAEEQLGAFKDAISKPYGMVLVTGPTGSGKTTTLYSGLAELNETTVNIATAEDPVEFNLHGINQVQMKDDIGLNFAAALRSFLRQDPDIIMVGEIRDYETAEIAIKAALTGHLVLSTLHTN